MEFQEKLRSLRKERGETQAQVATAIGIGERHYQKFESGNNLPSFHNLCALADHFTCPWTIWRAGRTGGTCGNERGADREDGHDHLSGAL